MQISRNSSKNSEDRKHCAKTSAAAHRKRNEASGQFTMNTGRRSGQLEQDRPDDHHRPDQHTDRRETGAGSGPDDHRHASWPARSTWRRCANSSPLGLWASKRPVLLLAAKFLLVAIGAFLLPAAQFGAATSQGNGTLQTTPPATTGRQIDKSAPTRGRELERSRSQAAAELLLAPWQTSLRNGQNNVIQSTGG